MIIQNIGEFVDALHYLAAGKVLVVSGIGHASLDGNPIYSSTAVLIKYGLVEEFTNPDGFAGLNYFRISSQGRTFASKALQAWNQIGSFRRLLIRLAN